MNGLHCGTERIELGDHGIYLSVVVCCKVYNKSLINWAQSVSQSVSQ